MRVEAVVPIVMNSLILQEEMEEAYTARQTQQELLASETKKMTELTSEKCGTLGQGYGEYYGSGCGGKYGGGAGKQYAGGGGGSGSIDKVISAGFWKAETRGSNHTGPGTARITYLYPLFYPSICYYHYSYSYLFWISLSILISSPYW